MEQNCGKNEIPTNVVMKCLNSMLKFEEKYGFLKIFRSLFLLFITAILTIFIYLLYNVVYNPDVYLDKVLNYFGDRQIELMQDKMESNYRVNSLIDELLYKAKADRVIIAEYHNGSHNSNGIPFYKFSVTFEARSEGTISIADQYKDVFLSMFSLPQHLFKQGYWYGNVEELKLIDEHLYYKIKFNRGDYLSLIQLHGLYNDVGFLCISYKNQPTIELEELGKLTRKYASMIEVILSTKSSELNSERLNKINASK